MKRIFILTLTFLMAGTALLNAQTTRVHGTVKGIAANTKVLLREVVEGNKLVLRDSATIAKTGNYAFRLETKEPAFYIMEFELQKKPSIHIIALPGEDITLDLRYVSSFGHMRVARTHGSENMQLYKQFNNAMVAGSDESSQWYLKHNIQELLIDYSDCLMSAFLVTFFEDDFNDYGGVYKIVRDGLIDKYPNNDFVRHLDDKLRTSVVAGMEAPEVALNDPNGKLRKLSDLRGKVVLLDFWASWCGPCRKENPNVVKLYNKYHGQGFEVFSVSLDNNKDRWTKAIMDDGLMWENHVSDLRGWSSAGSKPYGISSIPATVLIDTEGKIIARNLRGPELENALREIFGN
ncbi:MAG: AhpC/TSA family protein [Bacteroidales bacterium]|nr:AhpC/TSA family protein [Bacteroidales bacterium]